MKNLGYFSTKKILENLNVKRNIKKLTIATEKGDARAMEKIGVDFLRKVVKEDIDIFEGLLSAIYWFDKAVENGKIDSNYWIGETIDFYAYYGIGGQAYYTASFRDFIQSTKCKHMFYEVIESKKGYLYKIIQENGIFFFENKDFYQKATDVGDSSATFRLGEIYFNWWFVEYYEHIKYQETLSNSNYLSLAQKYLHYAFTHEEPDVISLIFKALKIIEEL